jgi:hypothetical protein
MPAGSKAPKLLTNEQGTNDRFGLGGRPPSVKLQGKEIAMGIEGLTKRFWQCRSRSRSLLSSSPVADGAARAGCPSDFLRGRAESRPPADPQLGAAERRRG